MDRVIRKTKKIQDSTALDFFIPIYVPGNRCGKMS